MSPNLDAEARTVVEQYIATTLHSMPEHPRAGVAAESIALGGPSWLAHRAGGLYHRLPSDLAEEWRRDYQIEEFGQDALDTYAERIEQELGVSLLPGAPPPSSAVLERGATKLGWRSVEFSRVFKYEPNGRAVKQTMARTMLPSAIEAGARVLADCRVAPPGRDGERVVGARCGRKLPDRSPCPNLL